MKQNAWILRFGEIGLKSRVVRRQFTRALKKNMQSQSFSANINLNQDRIETMDVVTSDSTKEEVESLLSHVLGVVAIDPIELISEQLDPSHVAKIILSKDPRLGEKRTFGVRVRRVGEKSEWGSQSYARAIGSSMWDLDNCLKVDLTNPDQWVRLVISPDKVWLMGERIEGPGGLPPGVQGNVLSRIVDESTLMSTFLIMRRGSRVIPIEDSKEEYIQILKRWDPFLGKYSTEHSVTGQKRKRHPWGVIGMSVSEGYGLITKRADDVKTVPLSTLEPLCGWTETEKKSLLKHIIDPQKHVAMPNIEGWVS